MAEKNLKELLTKYVPDDGLEQILLTGIVTKTKVDKGQRILEVWVDFPYLIDKETLYGIEEQVTEAYHLSHFKLLPHYPSELFGEGYIPELLKETERIGVVARGFFSSYRHTLREDTLTITRYMDGGVDGLGQPTTCRDRKVITITRK